MMSSKSAAATSGHHHSARVGVVEAAGPDGPRPRSSMRVGSGFCVLAATQRPSTDIVAGSLRALFAFRWALRCSTPDDSDTILGRRWAARGAASCGAGRCGAGH